MRTITTILITTVAVILGAMLLPGVYIDSFKDAIIVAIILALLNYFIKPVIVFLTIPVSVFSFGIFLLVINSLIILLADLLSSGFEVNGFWWALVFSIVLSVVTSIFNQLQNQNARG